MKFGKMHQHFRNTKTVPISIAMKWADILAVRLLPLLSLLLVTMVKITWLGGLNWHKEKFTSQLKNIFSFLPLIWSLLVCCLRQENNWFMLSVSHFGINQTHDPHKAHKPVISNYFSITWPHIKYLRRLNCTFLLKRIMLFKLVYKAFRY